MKNWIKLLIFITSILISASCKEDVPDVNENDIKVAVGNSETYEYDFNISGDEEGAMIVTQAEHFQISEIIRDETTNWSIVYRYKPRDNYIGNDFVEIQTCTGGQGSGCIDLTLVRINFIIRN